MKIINDIGLPAPIIRAIEQDDYDAGDSDITVTTLNNPPHIRYLMKKHADKLEEKASGRLFSLMGKMMHKLLEHAGNNADGLEHLIFERRLFAERDGWKISGQVDVIDTDTGTITDYKVCSYWTAIHGIKDEWVQQQNIYRLLAKENGFDIRNLQIAALYRDWSPTEAERKADYPKTQMQIIELPVWSYEQTEKYLAERIRLHKDSKPPVCSPSERWETDTKYAIEKDGRKSAIKLCDTLQEANAWMSANLRPDEIGKVKVNRRQGTPKRCARYCPVAKYCSFGKEWVND